MTFLYIFLGILIGSLGIYLILKPQLKNAEKENHKLKVKINMLQDENNKVKQELEQQTEMQKKWERRFYQLQYKSQTPQQKINLSKNVIHKGEIKQ